MELIKKCKKLWNVAWDMWDHCNEALHSAADKSKLIHDSKVNDEICSIYALGLQALPRDAFAFLQLPLEAQLTKPSQVNEQWVASVREAMKRKTQHEYGNY